MAAVATAAALRLLSCCRMWQGGFGASMQMVAAAATAARPIRIPDRRVVYEAAPPSPALIAPSRPPGRRSTNRRRSAEFAFSFRFYW